MIAKKSSAIKFPIHFGFGNLFTLYKIHSQYKRFGED